MLNLKRFINIWLKSYQSYPSKLNQSTLRSNSFLILNHRHYFSLNSPYQKQQQKINIDIKNTTRSIKKQTISAAKNHQKEEKPNQQSNKQQKQTNYHNIQQKFMQLIKYIVVTCGILVLLPEWLLNKLNNLKNRATVDYNIEKSKEDKKKTQQQQLQKFRTKFMQNINSQKKNNPFVNYQKYRIIEKLLINQLNMKDYEHNLMWIIQGIPGIGKTTSIINLIYQFTKGNGIGLDKIKAEDIKNTQIYYASLKGINSRSYQNQKDNGEASIRINEVLKLMNILIERAQNDKQKNIVLIIDQLNSMCNQKYKSIIKQRLRGCLQSIKLIGLSSCPQSTTQWVNWNQYFNQIITLKPNSPSQNKQFIRHSLGKSIIISDKILQIISHKFSTFRNLSQSVEQFKKVMNSNQKININQQSIKHFCPRTNQTLNRIAIIIEQCFAKQAQKNKQNQKQNKIIYKWLLFNELIGVLANEYSLATGQNILYEGFQQFKKKYGPIMDSDVDLSIGDISQMAKYLQQKDILFSIRPDEITKPMMYFAKNEAMRQIIYYYLRQQMTYINNYKPSQIQQFNLLIKALYESCLKNSQILSKFQIWQNSYGLLQAIAEDEKIKNQKASRKVDKII